MLTRDLFAVANLIIVLRSQEKLLANLDEDQQSDASFAGGDEVGDIANSLILLTRTTNYTDLQCGNAVQRQIAPCLKASVILMDVEQRPNRRMSRKKINVVFMKFVNIISLSCSLVMHQR